MGPFGLPRDVLLQEGRRLERLLAVLAAEQLAQKVSKSNNPGTPAPVSESNSGLLLSIPAFLFSPGVERIMPLLAQEDP
eukprot:34088-Prorocentrum_minimum.AAC.2